MGDNFAYATQHVFNWVDTVGSCIFPPASYFEGWYYFGMLGVFLLALFVMGPRDNPMSVKRHRILITCFFIWIAMVSYTTYGRQSYLFEFLWKHMPFFSRLRDWGRMNIVLVPILAWLLALAYEYLENHLFKNKTSVKLKGPLPLETVLIGVFLAVIAIQFSFAYFGVHEHHWAHYAVPIVASQDLWIPKMVSRFYAAPFFFFNFLAFGVLWLLLRSSKRLRSSARGWVLAALVACSACDLSIVGPWIYDAGRFPVLPRQRLNVQRLDEASFFTPRIDEYMTVTPGAFFSVGIIQDWYFERYVGFRRRTEKERIAREYLLGLINGQKLFFSQRIDHRSIRSYLRDASRFKSLVRIEFYNGDQLVLDVRTPSNGYLSFIDNWDPDWRAEVDGQSAPIQLLFGTFKTVFVPKGSHRVIFSYRPRFLKGLSYIPLQG